MWLLYIPYRIDCSTMNIRGTLVDIDQAVIDAARSEGYRKGWDDRRMHDSGIIEQCLRESRNYREFIAALRERMELLDE